MVRPGWLFYNFGGAVAKQNISSLRFSFWFFFGIFSEKGHFYEMKFDNLENKICGKFFE